MMDEAHLASAVRYVSLNPVRARLSEHAGGWPWSSVRAHLAGKDDALERVTPVLDRYGSFADFLGEPVDDADAWRILRQAKTSGRPGGNAEWIAAIEIRTGRKLAPQKRGPKPKGEIDSHI